LPTQGSTSCGPLYFECLLVGGLDSVLSESLSFIELETAGDELIDPDPSPIETFAVFEAFEGFQGFGGSVLRKPVAGNTSDETGTGRVVLVLVLCNFEPLGVGMRRCCEGV
jgi:hypothetical protein